MNEFVKKLGNKWIIVISLAVFVCNTSLLYVSTNKFGVVFYAFVFACVLNRILYKISKTEILSFAKSLYYIIAGSIVFHYFAVLRQPTGFWDTWQVWDMSRYVFTDFGYMENIRQHIVNTHYEMAFPPITPAMIAILNNICDIGVECAIFLSAIFALLTIAAFIKLGSVLKHNSMVAITAIVAMCNSEYINLYVTGNTQIFGFLAMLYIYSVICDWRNFNALVAFNCAFVAGLGLMNRFDFLSITPLVLLAIPVLMIVNKFNRKKTFLVAFLSAMIAGVAVSPWIIYSEIRFNKFFITDNGRRLFTVEDTRPSTFYCEHEPFHSIKTNPKEWLVAFSKRVMVSLKGGMGFIALQSLFFPLLIILLFLNFADGRINAYFDIQKLKYAIKNCFISKRIAYLITVIICVLQEMLILFTGYGDGRYHIPFSVFTTILLLICLSDTIKRYCSINIENFVKNRLFLFFVLFFAFGIGLRVNLSAIKKIIVGNGFKNYLELDGNELAISNYLKESNCKTLLVNRNEKTLEVPRFLALIGSLSNIISHSNLSANNIDAFIDTFAPDYFYSSIEKDNEAVRTKFNLVKTSFANLYKIEK